MKDKIIYWLEQIHVALAGIGKSVEPKSPLSVSNIAALTNEQLDALNVGDQVIKVTGKQKHLYIVTYKGEGAGEGICITYTAAGYGETVAYDRTESGWAYNSTDIKTYGD